jgi:hypothetical protein
MLIWKDYKRVQQWHRKHNSHHLEYDKEYDFEAMVIDWECSRFTKIASPLTARQEFETNIYTNSDLPSWVKHGIESALIKLGL